MSQTQFVDEIKKHVLCSITAFPKSCRLRDNVEEISYSRAGHRWQFGACALHAGYIRLQKHTLRI